MSKGSPLKNRACVNPACTSILSMQWRRGLCTACYKFWCARGIQGRSRQNGPNAHIIWSRKMTLPSTVRFVANGHLLTMAPTPSAAAPALPRVLEARSSAVTPPGQPPNDLNPPFLAKPKQDFQYPLHLPQLDIRARAVSDNLKKYRYRH